MTNRYIRDARISERKFKEWVKMFCADVPALTASKLTVVNRKTSQRIYELLRRRTVAVDEAKPFTGEVEIEESYFGPRRVRGKRGRGAGGKTPVIGLLKRGGKVFTGVVPNGEFNFEVQHVTNLLGPSISDPMQNPSHCH